MKLEYLPNITPDESLIRLWDFGQQESRQFQELLIAFVEDEQRTQLPLHEQQFVSPLNCQLTLVKDELNNGIIQLSQYEFICNLNLEGLTHIVHLIEPFVREDSDGYQWLDEKADAGDIDFLFSPGGSW